ncbi:hypothetical protein IAT40_004583 [Kwoniella sp. CBS 6097]
MQHESAKASSSHPAPDQPSADDIQVSNEPVPDADTSTQTHTHAQDRTGEPAISRVGMITAKSKNSIDSYSSLKVVGEELDIQLPSVPKTPNGEVVINAQPQQRNGSSASVTSIPHIPKRPSLSVILQDSRPFYRGALWRFYRGTLTMVTGFQHVPQHLPVVLKIMRPSEFPETQNWEQVEYYHDEALTSRIAWTLVRNEDRILRNLIDLQGGPVPNYYGLYAWYDKTRAGSKQSKPDTVFMVMEDVGEQKCEPSCRKLNTLNPDDQRKVVACYKALHHHKVVHGFKRVGPRHLLRRTVKDDDENLNFSGDFVIVDFQRAEMFPEDPEDKLDMLAADKMRLRNELGFKLDKATERLLLS